MTPPHPRPLHVLHVLHLCDVLPEADVRAPSPAHVEIQVMDVGGVQETALFQHADSEVRFPLPEGFGGGRLRLACGVATRAWPGMGGPIGFRIGVEDQGRVRLLHESTLDPRSVPRDRGWRPVEVE
ncbi:MAG: hypothetical protein HY658_01160, partial [Actinobacteria bacterium]|nr:hypothetical protein [Actinomycetota bacterium]